MSDKKRTGYTGRVKGARLDAPERAPRSSQHPAMSQMLRVPARAHMQASRCLVARAVHAPELAPVAADVVQVAVLGDLHLKEELMAPFLDAREHVRVRKTHLAL